MTKYYADTLAEFVSGFEFSRIPAEVLRKAKFSILDNLGLAMGGSHSEASQAVLSVVRALNGPKEATVFRFGDRLSANLAVMANGTMTHSNDFTDTMLPCVAHFGPVVVPTAMAMSEKLRLDGKSLLTLVTLGYEVAGRVGYAINSKPAMVHHLKGFHATSTCGVFGASTIAAKALGLEPAKTANALGIAGSSAAGLIESFTGPVGADTSRTHPGKAGHDGILSALLAEKGLTGPHTVFEGRDGFLHAYSERDQFLPELMIEDLGSRFKIMDVSIKWHNGTHAIASSADALQAIVQEHSIQPEEVEEIRAFVPKMHAFIGGPDPEAMYVPANYLKAQMSLPYTLSIMLLDREIFLDQYAPEKLRDKRVLEYARKVKVTADPEMDRMLNDGMWPSRVQLITKGGRSYESLFRFPKGSPQNPLTDAELQSKFTRLSKKVLDENRIREIIRVVNDVENLKEVASLTKLLVQ